MDKCHASKLQGMSFTSFQRGLRFGRVTAYLKYLFQYLVAFLRNERTHPNFVSQALEIQIFCEDCKLVPPPGFFRGFGLVVEYIVPGDEVDACACWLGFFRGFGLVVELINNYHPCHAVSREKIKAKALKKNVFFFQ